MICHVVLIRLRRGVSPEHKTRLLEQAIEVLVPIPGVKNLKAGKALRPEYPHPLCLVMDFDDQAALQAYQVHPEHQRFVNDILGPFVEDKKVYDYVY